MTAILITWLPFVEIKHEVVMHFPEPVTNIASSTCCDKEEDCGSELALVAAYSYKKDRL